MMYSYVASRCTHIGCAALVATSLTVGIAAPQVTHTPSYASRSVGLEVALTSAVLNTASASAEAAATSDPFKQILEVGLGLAIAPFWYLGFPVTFPIVLAADINYLYSTIARTNLAAAIGLAIPLALVTWPVGPFGIALDLVNRFFPAGSTGTTPAAGRTANGAAVRDPGFTGGPLQARVAIQAPKAAAITPAASATADDPLIPIRNFVVNVAGLLLAPLWYAAFPVTWGLTNQYLVDTDPFFTGPVLAGFVGLIRAARQLNAFLSMPFRFSDFVFRTGVTAASATAVQPASASRKAASVATVSPRSAKRGDEVNAGLNRNNVRAAGAKVRSRGASKSAAATATPRPDAARVGRSTASASQA